MMRRARPRIWWSFRATSRRAAPIPRRRRTSSTWGSVSAWRRESSEPSVRGGSRAWGGSRRAGRAIRKKKKGERKERSPTPEQRLVATSARNCSQASSLLTNRSFPSPGAHAPASRPTSAARGPRSGMSRSLARLEAGPCSCPRRETIMTRRRMRQIEDIERILARQSAMASQGAHSSTKTYPSWPI